MELGLALVLLQYHDLVLTFIDGLEVRKGVQLLLHLGVTKQAVSEV